MTTDDNSTKFWIGIASAFVIPSLAYSYAQGSTVQSINTLTRTVEQLQSTIDKVNDKIDKQSNRITTIETVQSLGGKK